MTRRKALMGIAGTVLGAIGVGSVSAGSDASTPADRRASAAVGNGPWDIRVPDDYPSVQAALDAATEGDRIGVGDGHYDGGITISTPGVSLQAVSDKRPTLDATGMGTGIRIEAAGVTVDGFEIVGDAETTSGISIVTSAGATTDITIRGNHIHGMAKAGGGGRFKVSSWGILSYGNQPLSGVRIERNRIENIGGDRGGDGFSYQEILVDPVGIGIDLEEVQGRRHGDGAVVRENRVADIHDGSVSNVPLPGIGIAVQPLDGGSSDARAPATDVTRNEIVRTSFNVLLGNCEHARVWENVD